ncbi:hypothetical protein [Hymenobacter sp. UYP22]
MKVTLSSLSEVLAAQRRAGQAATSRKKPAAKLPVAAATPESAPHGK